MFGSIVVIGLRELMLYKFELCHDPMEVTKNVCVKSEVTIDHGTISM